MLDKERGKICRKAFHYIARIHSRQAKALNNSPCAVLDTNVVLDWFVFGNPCVAALAQAIEGGRLRWLGCAEMQVELGHVLVHGSFGGRQADVEHVLTSFERLCSRVRLPPLLPAHRLRCSDASDQMFIDLALDQRADWLLTRDRALLKLTRKAALQGLRIATPETWRAAGACA